MGITAIDLGNNYRLDNVVINGKLQSIFVSKGSQLRSIVFSPKTYYQGIEAIGVDAYKYQPITLANATADITKNQSGDKISKRGSVCSVVPDVTMSYFLNPSNAIITEKASKFEFEVNNASFTRAAIASADLTVTKVKREGGKLNVVAKIKNAQNIAVIPADGDGKVDVAALKYTDKGANGDTTIISDFAALKRYDIEKFWINKVSREGNVTEAKTVQDLHLPVTAQDAITRGPLFTVEYEGKNIDFSKWINVHYNRNNGGDITWGGKNEIAEKNFSLVYELIGYIAGSNQTNESAHGWIDGTVFTPCGVANGQPTKQPARGSIGRTPLVRVKLLDGNSNNAIVAVGYMLIGITDKVIEDVEVGAYSKDNSFNVNCDPADILLGKMLSWEEVENDIFNHGNIDLSREQFDDIYKLDTDGNGVAFQYKKDASGKYVKTSPIFGEVRSTTSDQEAHKTDVLTWTVTNNEAYNWFKNNSNIEKTVVVRFTPKNASDINVRPNIYVTLTWKPKDRKVTPNAAITSADKVYAVWYEKNSNTLGSSDLHAHVEEAKTGNNDMFNFSVAKSTFKDAEGNVVNPKVIIANSLKGNGYSNLAGDELTIKYRFVKPDYAKAGSAKNDKKDYYDLTVKGEKELQASHGSGVKTTIAQLDQSTGAIEYLKNSVSEDILNYAKHNQLDNGQTLTAKVEIVANTCEPAKDIALNGNMINVKFLRPINVDGTSVTFVDSDPSTHTANLGKGQKYKFNFTDWRDFDNDQVFASGSVTLFNYYKVAKIEQDNSRSVLSNFADGSSFKPLSKEDFVFTYTGPSVAEGSYITDADQGTLTYKKNTTVTVHTFKVKVPVIITYDWGKLYAEIDVTVEPTVNNAKAHR